MKTEKDYKNPTIKSVAFNPDDPDQLALLKHAQLRSSFSGYVKRLIQRDMEGGSSGRLMNEEAPADRELMKGLI